MKKDVLRFHSRFIYRCHRVPKVFDDSRARNLVRSDYQKYIDLVVPQIISRRVFPHEALNPACSEQLCIEEDSLAFKSSR